MIAKCVEIVLACQFDKIHLTNIYMIYRRDSLRGMFCCVRSPDKYNDKNDKHR